MVTASGVVLFSGKRDESPEAFSILVSSYYLYNMSYDKNRKGKATGKETRNFMDFVFM